MKKNEFIESVVVTANSQDKMHRRDFIKAAGMATLAASAARKSIQSGRPIAISELTDLKLG